MSDPYNLRRFVDAQDGVFEQARTQLQNGRKTSHWMWFIFPQIAGLGRSHTASLFAISSRAEAQAYLDHPVLGPRLTECTRLVNRLTGRSLEQIFGYPDNLKFSSSMTLFAQVAGNSPVFVEALQKYCGGEPDQLTLRLLSSPDAFNV
jgi:uncharacterized protein (DUF1810 family)